MITNANLRVAIGDSWQPKALSYFAMVMMALMLITNVLNLKFINLFGLSVIASMLVYTFSLIIADIMTEVYGYRRVRKLLYVGLGCLVAYAIFLQIALIMPPAEGYQNNAAFSALFSQTPRIVLASISSYFIGELINSYVMSFLKIKLCARFFYGRATIAVGLAQLISGIAFFMIAYFGVMPLTSIISAMLFSWLMVMICEIAVLPVTKKLAYRVKLYEGIEHYDAEPTTAKAN